MLFKLTAAKEEKKQRGTFLMLVIKGKNKRGTMKIKENKQWSSLFLFHCLWSLAVCPTMGEEQDWGVGFQVGSPLYTRTARRPHWARAMGPGRHDSHSPLLPRRSWACGCIGKELGGRMAQAEEGHEPGLNAAWPLSVRCGSALRYSPRGIHNNLLSSGLKPAWRPNQIVDNLLHHT